MCWAPLFLCASPHGTICLLMVMPRVPQAPQTQFRTSHAPIQHLYWHSPQAQLSMEHLIHRVSRNLKFALDSSLSLTLISNLSESRFSFANVTCYHLVHAINPCCLDNHTHKPAQSPLSPPTVHSPPSSCGHDFKM